MKKFAPLFAICVALVLSTAAHAFHIVEAPKVQSVPSEGADALYDVTFACYEEPSVADKMVGIRFLQDAHVAAGDKIVTIAWLPLPDKKKNVVRYIVKNAKPAMSSFALREGNNYTRSYKVESDRMDAAGVQSFKLSVGLMVTALGVLAPSTDLEVAHAEGDEADGEFHIHVSALDHPDAPGGILK